MNTLPTLTGSLEGDLAGLTGSQYDDPLDPGLGRQMCSRGQVTAARTQCRQVYLVVKRNRFCWPTA